MANPKIDWAKAKQEYIATKEMSLKDVAFRFGISYQRVKSVSMQEGWTKEKAKMWHEAEREALEETEGSIKDLVQRHAKVARYLQAGGLKYLKAILDELEETFKANPEEGRKLLKTLIVNKVIDTRILMSMVSEGLKAERELYPKQLQIKGDLGLGIGISEELKEAAYEVLKQKLRRGKRRTGKSDTRRKK